MPMLGDDTGLVHSRIFSKHLLNLPLEFEDEVFDNLLQGRGFGLCTRTYGT
jgi:hypothetical protein